MDEIMLNKRILSSFGAVEAVFLCNLIDTYHYFLLSGQLQDKNKFYCTNESQMKLLRVGERKLQNMKKKFKQLGVISTEMQGLPAKEHYSLNLDKLGEILINKAFSKKERRAIDAQ